MATQNLIMIVSNCTDDPIKILVWPVKLEVLFSALQRKHGLRYKSLKTRHHCIHYNTTALQPTWTRCRRCPPLGTSGPPVPPAVGPRSCCHLAGPVRQESGTQSVTYTHTHTHTSSSCESWRNSWTHTTILPDVDVQIQ